MRRSLIVAAAVAVLAIGSTVAVFAQTPTPPANPGYGSWGCGGWAGSNGSYDPASNPTIQQLAEKLGIGAADLVKELQGGKSVADVAAEKNVDEQVLVDVLLAPQSDMLNIRVKYGYLTQDQADSMLKFMADRVKYQLEQKGFFGGFGVMGGYGGYGMGGGYGGGMMGPRGGFNGGPGFRGPSY